VPIDFYVPALRHLLRVLILNQRHLCIKIMDFRLVVSNKRGVEDFFQEKLSTGSRQRSTLSPFILQVFSLVGFAKGLSQWEVDSEKKSARFSK
jgi:hypothetical protein